MKTKIFFLFLLFSTFFYFGCKKENPNVIHVPDQVLHQNSSYHDSIAHPALTFTDSLAGSYIVWGTEHYVTVAPDGGAVVFDSTYIISNDTFVFTKLNDSVLQSPNQFEWSLPATYTYTYHPLNSNGSLNCFSFDWSGPSMTGADTIWFVKNDPDSIQMHFNDRVHTLTGIYYSLSGRKIH